MSSKYLRLVKDYEVAVNIHRKFPNKRNKVAIGRKLNAVLEQVKQGGLIIMTKQQFDELYLGKAVHCDTEEKANKFLELAHGFGYKWRNGISLLEENCYHYYQEKTCYLVNGYGFEYCDKYYYIEEDYEVVKFKQQKEEL